MSKLALATAKPLSWHRVPFPAPNAWAWVENGRNLGEPMAIFLTVGCNYDVFYQKPFGGRIFGPGLSKSKWHKQPILQVINFYCPPISMFYLL
jgi:hypothetical protein